MSNKVAQVPKLKNGHDAAAAKLLTSLYSEAQNGLRKVVAVGLACFEIKEQLKHGQFKPWLEANCAGISYRSLAAYMQLTKNVLSVCGFKTLGAYFKSAEALHFSHGGEILLLPDSKVPAEAKPLREKICSVIDGKTQSQLFLEFKQVDEEEDEEVKPKRGRLKGHGGATKEQRAKAAAAEEAARVEALLLKEEEIAEWLDENAGVKGIGQTAGTKEFAKLLKAMEHAVGFMRRIADQKGGRQ